MGSDPQKPTRRLERFLIFRLAVIPFGFILVAICRSSLEQELREPAFRFLFGLLSSYTVLALGALLFAGRVKSPGRFALVQVVIDFGVTGALIWATGGVESVFCPLLFATLFNATTVLGGRAGLAFASVATAFLATATISYQLGRGPAISPWAGRSAGADPAGAAAHLLALGLALHVVALLGTRLSHGLRSMQSIQEEIIENMAEGLVAVDGRMRVLELNGEARRIFGLSQEAGRPGRRLEEVFAGKGLQPVREAFAAAERKRVEFEIPRAEGGIRPVEAKVSRILDDHGRLRAGIGLFGDLSLKKEIEVAEERIQKLEELYDMALGIAHEIRNPLASIQGCAQEIRRFSGEGQKESKLVDIICRESGRLDRLIEDFVTSARRGPADLVPVDLVQVMEETVLQLKNHPRLGRRRVVLEPPPGPAEIRGDFPRLKQVFLNLGQNAIDSTSPEQGEIRFSFRDREFLALNRRRAGERRMVPGVEVEVADNGAGISRDTETLIFTPFFTTKEDGQGLGLTIVHRIVREHYGTVRVESEPGAGARFKVWFPRLEEAASGQPAGERQLAHV